MSTNQDEIMNSDEIYDFVYILGKDNPGQTHMQETYERIRKDCEARGLQYFILGDGKTDLALKDLDILPQARNVAVHVHGNINDGKHTSYFNDEIPRINSIDMIKKLQEKTNAKDIVYSACFAGKIGQELENGDYRLLEGTNLILPSPPDNVSFSNDSEMIFNKLLDQITPGSKTSLIWLFVELFHTTPQSMTMVNQSAKETPDLFKIHRLDRAIYTQVVKLCKHRVMEFAVAIKTWQIDNQDEIADLISSYEMSNEQIKEFHNNSLSLHVLYNDHEILDVLLKNNIPEKQKILSKLMYQMIFQAPLDLKNRIKMLEILIKHGGDIDTFDSLGTIIKDTPLTLALNENQIDIVKALLDHKADIYKADGNGKIPANILQDEKYKSVFDDSRKMANNLVALAEIFLKPECTQYLDNDPSLKALIFDAQAKKDEFERLCQAQGDQQFYSGETHVPKNKAVFEAFTAFTNSAKKIPYPDILLAQENTLVEEIVKDKLGEELLVIAAQKGEPELIERLLDSDLDANLKVGQPPTDPLSCAIENGHGKIVKILLDKGVTPEQTHLLNAAKKGNLAIFNMVGGKYRKFLHSANIAVDEGLGPLLHEVDNVQIMEVLLKQKGIDINWKDANGKTPLDTAYEKNRPDIANYLLTKGASLTAQENDNSLDLASAAEASEINKSREARADSKQEPSAPIPLKQQPDLKLKYPDYCKLWMQAFEDIQSNPDFESIKGKTEESNVQAIKVILNDYTKGGDTWWAAFKRVITGHWNRHHVAEVDTVVKNIDNQTISSTKDLISTLEAIANKEGVNPAGTFRKQLSFIQEQIATEPTKGFKF